MNMVRQNTDYALRFLVNLARRSPGDRASARILARQEDVSHQFTCKILQRLHETGFVESTMGPKGGYALARDPAEISMADVITAVQGPFAVNTCMLGIDACPRRPECPISHRLETLQDRIDSFFRNTTLAELVHESRQNPTNETPTEETQ